MWKLMRINCSSGCVSRFYHSFSFSLFFAYGENLAVKAIAIIQANVTTTTLHHLKWALDFKTLDMSLSHFTFHVFTALFIPCAMSAAIHMSSSSLLLHSHRNATCILSNQIHSHKTPSECESCCSSSLSDEEMTVGKLQFTSLSCA